MKTIQTNQIEVPLELIKYIASLPNEIIKSYIKNEHQLILWKVMRLQNELLSESWKARHSGGNEPLEVYLEQGIISKDYYNIFLATLDYFDSLWVLCQRIFSKILKFYELENVECPFKNAFGLFSRIISDKQNATFSYYLKGCAELSSRSTAKAMRLHAKKLRGLKLSDKEADFLEKVAKNNQPLYDLWAEKILIGVANKYANRNNPGIKAAYDSLMENWARLDELTARSLGKEGSYRMEYGQITAIGDRGHYA
ncbi:MAG TPA: hypothetical protein VK211_12720 [Kamptonema sp.]|nr:hypothetical protein [Kamptonema sp.]